jgi:hypothetical protein
LLWLCHFKDVWTSQGLDASGSWQVSRRGRGLEVSCVGSIHFCCHCCSAAGCGSVTGCVVGRWLPAARQRCALAACVQDCMRLALRTDLSRLLCACHAAGLPLVSLTLLQLSYASCWLLWAAAVGCCCAGCVQPQHFSCKHLGASGGATGQEGCVSCTCLHSIQGNLAWCEHNGSVRWLAGSECQPCNAASQAIRHGSQLEPPTVLCLQQAPTTHRQHHSHWLAGSHACPSALCWLTPCGVPAPQRLPPSPAPA